MGRKVSAGVCNLALTWGLVNEQRDRNLGSCQSSKTCMSTTFVRKQAPYAYTYCTAHCYHYHTYACTSLCAYVRYRYSILVCYYYLMPSCYRQEVVAMVMYKLVCRSCTAIRRTKHIISLAHSPP